MLWFEFERTNRTHTMNIAHLFIILILIGSTFAKASVSENFTQLLNKRRVKRSQELILSPESVCDRFSNPIASNKTFFSPNDGNENYLPQADCILILEAPDNYVIQLDFRNNFNIELSPNCEYDFLEVRDGKYGWSDFLGRFCGNQFPSIITSSDKYLWLYFHSDDNIEYYGFEGVYNFTLRPLNLAKRTECFMTMNNTIEGVISENDIDKEIKNAVMEENTALDCIWMIEVESNWQIAMSFEKFDLISKNDCINNFIDVYGNDTNISSPLKHFCAVVAEPFESKSNRLHIRFYANRATVNSSFTIYYSTFRKKMRGTCEPHELDCEDDTCIISEGLKCNKRPNCKFQKDEEDCPPVDEEKKNDLLFIIIVFSGLLGAMTAVFFFNCIRKLIRDQKIIREHIRQSKESKLDEAGRTSMKRSLENINRIAPRTAGYAPPLTAKTIQIQDENGGRQFGETDSASLSASSNRINKSKYNYGEQLKNISPNARAETVNSTTDQYTTTFGTVCDMACQTRDSLFETGISSSSSGSKFTQSNSQPPDTYKFSTFGYNNATSPYAPIHHHQGQQQEQQQQRTAPHYYRCATNRDCYENRVAAQFDAAQNVVQYAHVPFASSTPSAPPSTTATLSSHDEIDADISLPPPPPPPSSHTPVNNAHNFNAPKKKTEESRIMLEIRSSAPDVIIMTASH